MRMVKGKYGMAAIFQASMMAKLEWDVHDVRGPRPIPARVMWLEIELPTISRDKL